MLNKFNNYLKLHVDSLNGQIQYLSRMKLFFKHHQEFNKTTVDSYLANCASRKLKPNTFNGYMNALKQYAKFIKLDIEFPKQKKRTKKKRTNKKTYLTREELEEELFPYFSLLFKDYEKRKTILRLMITTGMRPQEVVNLKKEDIDFKNDVINIENTKDKDDRFAYINQNIKTELKYLIDQSKSESALDISLRYIKYIFEKLNQELRYKKHLYAYQLKHGFGMHCVKSGIHITEIQRLMGHWDISMTMEYLETNDEDVKKSYLKMFKYKKKIIH